MRFNFKKIHSSPSFQILVLLDHFYPATLMAVELVKVMKLVGKEWVIFVVPFHYVVLGALL